MSAFLVTTLVWSVKGVTRTTVLSVPTTDIYKTDTATKAKVLSNVCLSAMPRERRMAFGRTKRSGLVIVVTLLAIPVREMGFKTVLDAINTQKMIADCTSMPQIEVLPSMLAVELK